jgi:hypothetical protein
VPRPRGFGALANCRLPLALLLTSLVMIAACGDARVVLPPPTPTTLESTPGPVATPSPAPLPTPTPSGRAEIPENLEIETGDRLAIETADGRIFTIRPDGTSAVPLTDAGEGTLSSLATWSPDGNRLAWVATDPRTGRSRVRAARFDGSDWSDTEVDGRPVTLAWSDSGAHVATVSEGEHSLELGVVDLTEEGDFEVIDRDSPLFFAWSPGADALLVHGGGVRLDFVPIDGSAPASLESRPGSFQAPAWLSGGAPLVYADSRDGRDFLVVAGDEGAGRRPLVSYEGYLQYAVSESSGLIALRVLDKSRAPEAGALTVAHGLLQPEPDLVDEIERGLLVLIALFGGDPLVLHPTEIDPIEQPVEAFYWNPDGSALAWLVEIHAGDGACDSGTQVLQWRFWIDGRISTGPSFSPSPTFACDHMPLFDQHGQTDSYWSPEGTEIAYAGVDTATGDRGVFVVETRPGAAPRLVVDGEHAIWSPSTAGSAASSL